MDLLNLNLHPQWKKALANEFSEAYMDELRQFLISEKKSHKVIFPPEAEVFSALNCTPLDKVRVVILGQDPYHGAGQAHGLCFSVGPGVTIPPSLKNIFKELESDLGILPPAHGNLTHWADQGVLLLNAVLSVEQGKAASHRKRGWEFFTTRIIEILNQQDHPIVFLLWGSDAQKKGDLIDRNRHPVLMAPHPSPLSAHRGFLGCKHFSKTNTLLRSWGEPEIDWHIPPL